MIEGIFFQSRLVSIRFFFQQGLEVSKRCLGQSVQIVSTLKNGNDFSIAVFVCKPDDEFRQVGEVFVLQAKLSEWVASSGIEAG